MDSKNSFNPLHRGCFAVYPTTTPTRRQNHTSRDGGEFEGLCGFDTRQDGGGIGRKKGSLEMLIFELLGGGFKYVLFSRLLEEIDPI